MEKLTIDDFSKTLDDRLKALNGKLPNAIATCCELIRSTALEDMAKTPRNTNVSYFSGKNRTIEHHPSLPGNAPAPDTGNLRASIHYVVEESDESVIGRVGTDVDYGRMLELGTSNIAPRPWLRPSLEKNSHNIKKIIEEVLK